MQHWVEEVAGLADDRKIRELLRGFLGRRAVRVVGVVALLVVVVVLLFLVLNWYVAPTKPSEKKDLVVALAQILGGTALLSGLYFTWRPLQVNREGQITERFTRAIDQLGKVEDGRKLFEIRTGGIYALERIARESEADYWPIMEILTAYVRQNAPWRPEGEDTLLGQLDLADAEDATQEQSAMEGSGGSSEITEPLTLDPDIRAIMTVLRRRTRFYGHGESEPLDLRDTNLQGANLQGANLQGALLSRVNLQGALLSGANLSRAHLYEARLHDASLDRANLRNSDLMATNLTRAKLPFADLRGATLWLAKLDAADLRRADLSEAQYLHQEQLERTLMGDNHTKLPPGLEPPEDWGVKTDEQTEGG